MASSLQFALSNPVPGMEDEFVRWYGTDHLEHVVAVPGVLAGQLFQRVPGPFPSGKHDYMMIWELSDPAYALEQLAQAKGGDAMPISPALDFANVQPPTMWLQSVIGKASNVNNNRGSVVLGLFNANEGEDDAFVSTLMETELAVLADLPGINSISFLSLTDEQIRGSARKYRYGILIELNDESIALQALTPLLPALPHADPERWLAPVFCPIGQRLTQEQNEGSQQ